MIENKKVIIIDFDIFNNSITNLLGINKKIIEKNNNKIKNEKFNNKKINFNIENYIINCKNNIDLISGINLIYKSSQSINPQKIKNIINNLKNKYDLIIIDSSSDFLLDYSKEILKMCDYSIFISGANLLEIKKSKKLLEIYDKEWEIPKQKIKIIFNKWTQKSIDDEILKEIFKNYDILGKIKLSDYYDLAINKNNIKIKEIKNELKTIKKKLIKKNRN